MSPRVRGMGPGAGGRQREAGLGGGRPLRRRQGNPLTCPPPPTPGRAKPISGDYGGRKRAVPPCPRARAWPCSHGTLVPSTAAVSPAPMSLGHHQRPRACLDPTLTPQPPAMSPAQAHVGPHPYLQHGDVSTCTSHLHDAPTTSPRCPHIPVPSSPQASPQLAEVAVRSGATVRVGPRPPWPPDSIAPAQQLLAGGRKPAHGREMPSRGCCSIGPGTQQPARPHNPAPGLPGAPSPPAWHRVAVGWGGGSWWNQPTGTG